MKLTALLMANLYYYFFFSSLVMFFYFYVLFISKSCLYFLCNIIFSPFVVFFLPSFFIYFLHFCFNVINFAIFSFVLSGFCWLSEVAGKYPVVVAHVIKNFKLIFLRNEMCLHVFFFWKRYCVNTSKSLTSKVVFTLKT